MSTNENTMLKQVENLWDYRQFNDISEKIYKSIENFNPKSMNLILNSLIMLKQLNVVGVNMHTMLIKWLSSGDNIKYLDNEQLANSLISIARISYLQDKYNLINTKDIAKSLTNLLKTRLTSYNTIIVTQIVLSTYK